jgi:O-antigen ligase
VVNRLVYALLALASLPAAGLLAWLGPRWVLAGATVVLGLTVVVLTWPASGLWVLILAAGANRYELAIGGLSIYAEYLALVLVAALLAVDVMTGRRRWRWPPALWPLLGWLVCGLAASLMHAPNTLNSLALWTKLMIVVCIYLVTVNLAQARAEQAVSVQMLVGAGVAGFGLLTVVAWQRFHLDLGIVFKTDGGIVPTGSQWEPNIFGSYCLAVALLALPLSLTSSGRSWRQRLIPWLAFLLGCAGLIASLTRTAWIGFALAGALGLAAWAWRRPWKALAAAAGLCLAALCVVAVLRWSDLRFLLPQVDLSSSGALAQRLATFANLGTDGNVWVRQQILRHALSVWQEHPWIGWGIGAYSQVYLYPNANATSWIPNLIVHQLYNTGILGLGFFLLALALAGWRGFQAWRHAHGRARAWLGGLLLALVGLFVAFQATEASWLAYFWIYLGLLEAAASPILENAG